MAGTINRKGGIYVAINADYSQFMQGLKKVKEEASRLGPSLSAALKGSVSESRLSSSLTTLAKNLNKGAAAAQGLKSDLSQLDGGLAKVAAQAGLAGDKFSQLARQTFKGMAQSELTRSMNAVQRATGASNREMIQLRASIGDTTGALKLMGREAQSSLSQIANMRNAIVAGAAGYALSGTAQAAMQFETYQRSFNAISGSQAGGAEEMAFVRREANRLGQDLFALADAYRGLAAASMTSGLTQAQVRDVFSAVGEASTTLGLSSEQTKYALYALQQMMSKGVVSMEELRRQLGDSLPGAFSAAARAMNVTEAELTEMVENGEVISRDFLPKFAAEIRRTLGAGFSEAAGAAARNMTRLGNSIKEAKNAIGTGFLDEVSGGAVRLASALDKHQGALQTFGRGLGFAADNAGILAAALAGRKLAGPMGDTIQKFGQGALAARENAKAIAENAATSLKSAKVQLDYSKALAVKIQKEWDDSRAMVGKAKLTEAQQARMAAAAKELKKLPAINNAIAISEKSVAAALAASTAATRQASAATAALNGLRKAGSGLVGFLGGPWGAAFTVAAGATYLFMTRSSEAEKTAARLGLTLDSLSDKYKEITKRAEESAGKVDQASARMVEEQIKSLEIAIEANKKQVEASRAALEPLIERRAFAVISAPNLPTEIQDLWGALKNLSLEFKNGEITADEFAAALENVKEQAIQTKSSTFMGKVTVGPILKELETMITHLQVIRVAEDAIGKGTTGIDDLKKSAGSASAKLKELAEIQGLINKNQIKPPANLAEAAAILSKATEETKGFEAAQKEAQKSLVDTSMAMFVQQSALATMNGEWEAAIKYISLYGYYAGLLASGPKDKPRGGGGGGRKWTDELNSLLNSLDPLRAATEELTKGQGLLDRAMQAGKVTTADYERYVGLLKKRYDEAAQAADKTAEQIRLASEFQKEYLEVVGRSAEAEKISLDMRIANWQAYAKTIDDVIEKQKILGQIGEMSAKLQERIDGKEWAGGKQGFKDYFDSVSNGYVQMQDFAASSMRNIEDSLVNAFTTGKLSFSDMVNSILADFTRMAARMAIANIFSFFGFGAKPNALGNIYPANTGLSAFRNRVVSQPTFFAFAKGAGLMGEAGAEAIMPLTRTPSGELGVKATEGGGGQTITINTTYVVSSEVQKDSFRKAKRQMDEDLIQRIQKMGM